MSRNYLDLCRAFVAELGIAGGTGPSSVVGQSSELGNVVRWIAEADLSIINEWTDWKFMWTSGPVGQQITTGADTITTITDLGTEIEDGLVLTVANKGYRPEWIPFEQFRLAFRTNTKVTLARPTHWTVRPDGVIELSHRAASPIPWSMEYFKKPTRMTANASLSPIPDHIDRIILSRAALMYGGREDAPEIQLAMGAEYDDLLAKMEAQYLAGQRNHRRSRNGGRPQPDITGQSGNFGGFG